MEKGKKGGMLVAWNQNVEIMQMRKSDFCMEMQVDYETELVTFWVVLCMQAPMQGRERVSGKI